MIPGQKKCLPSPESCLQLCLQQTSEALCSCNLASLICSNATFWTGVVCRTSLTASVQLLPDNPVNTRHLQHPRRMCHTGWRRAENLFFALNLLHSAPLNFFCCQHLLPAHHFTELSRTHLSCHFFPCFVSNLQASNELNRLASSKRSHYVCLPAPRTYRQGYFKPTVTTSTRGDGRKVEKAMLAEDKAASSD